jgi:hypothetical protein
MKWVDIPDAKGTQQAVTWGNPQKGAHGSFAKFAGGTELPMHTHSQRCDPPEASHPDLRRRQNRPRRQHPDLLSRQLQQHALYLRSDSFIPVGDSFHIGLGHRKNLFRAVHLEAEPVVMLAYIAEFKLLDWGENLVAQY